MNYYDEIKNKIIDNEINRKVKTTLRRYRQFYNFVIGLKWSALPTKLSWSHITELMALCSDERIAVREYRII